MQELWSSASYEPHLLSLPFAFAPSAMLVVIAYALAMRGEPILRGWLLVHFAALMPYSVAMMLSPSLISAEAAEALMRIAAAFIPMAAAAGSGFQFRLLGLHRQARAFVWFGIAVAITWLVVGATSDAGVTGVRWIDIGLWYANAGEWAWLALLSTVTVATPGFVLLARAALRLPPGVERRHLRFVLAANVITYAGLSDVALAYDLGVFPLGWLLSGTGSVLLARALVAEDLLRVRAVDTTAPQLVLHAAGAMLLAWLALDLAPAGMPWWGAALIVALSFNAVRVTLAMIALIARGARRTASAHDRLLADLVTRSRPLETAPQIASLARDVIELGIAARVEILLAADDDYGWTTASGDKLADDAAPDPLLGSWLAEHRAPILASDLTAVPDDLRDALMPVLARSAARALIPVVSGEELLAVVLVPSAARKLRGRELPFLERACERFGEAIVHARMAQQAAARATIARQVELAATLQQQLLPGGGPRVHGDITIVGSWLPATRCAGDYWGVFPLGARGTLVAIGDVTGHGVASATVTAAATAAVEVVVRRSGEALDLLDLVAAVDAAVRRVGGGQLQMTCFAGILDQRAGEVRFVSCGHPTPYLCRPRGAGDIELQALVGRGNPLGGPSTTIPKVQQKPLRAGDLVVWYTDGVIEAQDPVGQEFGDRRLQRMLRKLDATQLAPDTVHGLIHASVAAHRAGRARGDDETLVVAHWREAAL